MNTGTLVPVKRGQIASYNGIEAILRNYFAENSGLSPHTLRAKRWDLGLFLESFQRHNDSVDGGYDLSTWLPIDTARFRAELVREQYAAASINRILSTLRAFSKWGRDKGLWHLDTCKGVSDLALPPLAPKALPDSDYYRIAKAAELLVHRPRRKYDESLRNRALVAVLASSGLRISEILSLRVKQFEGRRITNVLCKRGKVRPSVLISTSAAEVLRAYIENGRTSGSDYLFTNRYGQGPLSRNSAARALSMLAQLGGSPGRDIRANPHAFRHRVGRKARELRGDVFAAKRLGHADLRMVERYATSTDVEEEKLVDEIS